MASEELTAADNARASTNNLISFFLKVRAVTVPKIKNSKNLIKPKMWAGGDSEVKMFSKSTNIKNNEILLNKPVIFIGILNKKGKESAR
jgi:hypothetical protein